MEKCRRRVSQTINRPSPVYLKNYYNSSINDKQSILTNYYVPKYNGADRCEEIDLTLQKVN